MFGANYIHINVIINVRLKQQIKESYSSIVNLTSWDFKKDTISNAKEAQSKFCRWFR